MDYSVGDSSDWIIPNCCHLILLILVHYNYMTYQLERFKLLIIKAQTLTAAAVEGRVLGIPPL